MTTKRKNDLIIFASRALFALFSAGIAILVSVGVFLLGLRLVYTERVLPGVHSAGVDLSGMTNAEIRTTLSQAVTYPQTGLIALHDGDRFWIASPEEVGVSVDFNEIARQALSVGRTGNIIQRLQEQIDAWFLGHPIPTVIVFDHVYGGLYFERLAHLIDLPTREAYLSVNGVEIEVHPGQIGRRLDIEANLDILSDPISQLHDADLELVIEETPPRVLDVSDQAEVAREILREPLTLTVEDAGPWQIEPSDLAGILRFGVLESEEGVTYEVKLDTQAIITFLEPLLPELERDPENARVYFDDDTRELVLIEEAVIGRSLDIPESIKAINTGLVDGAHEIPLALEITEPVVGNDATAAELGISEPVSVVSTYFSGSSPERIQNIKTASSAFHGLLVAPGEELSMAEVLGDISLDNGYAEALIIYGDRTIKGVGGGVCQVSTTLFRAAFFGGYPILERHPHAYRVGYYEIGPTSPGPGLDATVFVPVVDMRFINDSPYWLLLETYIYGNQLLWKFYSTSDGRNIEWRRDILSETEAPEPLYRENPELPKGEIKQVDWEADGMDVVVYRIVSRDGEVLYQDKVETHYLPWRAIFEYGPGTELPDDAKTE
ncbi:MAG: VanW family protein [Anaerolineaceae bacterium]|nr:MAG: VanW family protein [Anaerolineaceae bacterium]